MNHESRKKNQIKTINGFTQHHFAFFRKDGFWVNLKGHGNKSGAGFTLIELIVVISVIGIISVLGIAGFNSYNQVQTLQTATSDVATMLNLAKSRALSQVKLGNCALSVRTLLEYGVSISTLDTYKLNVYCTGTIGPQNIETKTLPKNITFTSTRTFLFPVITGGVSEESGSPSPWEIKLSGFGRTRIINIDSVGGVKVQ